MMGKTWLVGCAVVLLAAATPGVWGAGADSASTTPLPERGEVVQPFTAEGVNGGTVEVKFRTPAVLLFFLSSCPTCHKMIPEWNRAYERRPDGLTVIGVIMDREPPGFFETMGISFPVVRAPSREFLRTLKVFRAPLTLRVQPGGVVEEARLGLLDPITLGQLFHP